MLPLSSQSKDNTILFAYDTTSVSGREKYRILENAAKYSTAPIYRLYKTRNKWTFLELNTCSGEVSKVQWTLDSNEHERFTQYIGRADNMGGVMFKDYFSGRFELYDTDNIYNFILLDTYTGKTWQVQWGIESKNNMVIPIE